MAVEIWERWKKGSKNYFFSLNGPALYLPPPPLNGPAINIRYFFRGFPKEPRNPLQTPSIPQLWGSTVLTAKSRKENFANFFRNIIVEGL